ncbi:hypothetical protein SCLCIDRAFT_98436, partial [Scleroderma citrinum Foug A]
MHQEDAFGFVDPTDILQCCHLVPAFSDGKQHSDGIALSQSSRDADDWKYYHVNQFVDHNMLMRYHWGLGVGHAYAHSTKPTSETQSVSDFSEG